MFEVYATLMPHSRFTRPVPGIAVAGHYARGVASGTKATRLLRLEDAPELTQALTAQREFMAPYEPVRDDDYYTVQGQTTLLSHLLDDRDQGRVLPLVIVAPDGALAGRITLNNIVRGPLQSASLGYWVRRELNGQGLATAAVAEALGIAFRELGLHRVEAGTLVDNVASQRVLTKNGFSRYGLAPHYLRIAGRWQDHVLFQRLADDDSDDR